MISKSKVGAIIFIAATGLAAIGLSAPASAANPPNYGPQNYAPSQAGGGTGGYNQRIETYRLKQHPTSHHNTK
jgi:hypothetical protein